MKELQAAFMQEQTPAERLLDHLIAYDGKLTSDYELRIRKYKKSQKVLVSLKKPKKK